MNRAQRRRLNKIRQFPAEDVQPDFSTVPLATVCQSIQLLINELRNRGYPVYDFDNKEKSVQGIQIIRDKVYFLAAEEAGHGEAQSKEKN